MVEAEISVGIDISEANCTTKNNRYSFLREIYDYTINKPTLVSTKSVILKILKREKRSIVKRLFVQDSMRRSQYCSQVHLLF